MAFWPASALAGLIGSAMAEPQLEKTEIRYQGWAGQVTFIELAEDLGYLAPLKLKWVGNTISGPQDIQTVVTGDIDIGGAFYGAIIKLIAAKAPIKAVVGYYGSDANTYYGYYVKEDSPIKTARDLIGKKVAVNTLGAHLEFVLREYLARNGLSAGRGQAGDAGGDPAGRGRAGVAAGPGRGDHAERRAARQGAGTRRHPHAVQRHRPVRQLYRRRLCAAGQVHQGQPQRLPQADRGHFARHRTGHRRLRRRRCAHASTASSPSASATRTRRRSSTGRAPVLRPRAA